jgi:hypothetical protein
MNTHKNSVKSNLLALLIGLVLAFVSAEVMLRMVTGNIYSDMNVIVDEIPRGIRLTWPMKNSMDATGLYEGGGKVDFHVTEMRNIYPGYENDGQELALFFGGSTTENSMVREGHRFADLIGKALDYYPMNYGKSGNASIESHINLVHLLEKYDFRPKIVFLLHGLNDYGIFLKSRSPEGISDIDVLLDARKGSANQEFIKKRFNSYIRKSYVIAHLYIAMKAIFGDSYLENLVKDARAQRELEPLTEEGFQSYVDSVSFRTFLENRKKTYAGFIRAAKESGARVVLFTQPASYTDSYKSYSGEEARVFPTTLDGKLMNFDQARRLQDLISNNTREAAREGIALLVDLDAHFTRQDVSPLIYDTLHYTEQGSKVIADLTVETIRRTGFLEDDAWLN